MSGDIIDQFRVAMAEAGIVYDGELIADGMRHRFKPDGDRRDNGVYQLWSDEHPGGWFKNFKRGIYQTWSLTNGRELSQAEQRAWRERRAIIEAERNKAEAEFREEARARALGKWEAAKPETGEHRYLRDKGVGAHGLRSNSFLLYVPVRDSGGMLHGLQYIPADGDKKFLTGTAVRGHYHLIGEPKDRILIAEGYATAATLHEVTGEAVAVAFDRGNLRPVAEALKGTYSIIVCADDDRKMRATPAYVRRWKRRVWLEVSSRSRGFRTLQATPPILTTLRRWKAQRPCVSASRMQGSRISPGGS